MTTHLRPEDTSRASAFYQYQNSAMPMVTLTKTFDVRNLLNRHQRFNALLCWCIGKAAACFPEFMLLPEKDGFIKYDPDRLGINVIVADRIGNIVPCDLPFSEDPVQFLSSYSKITEQVIESSVPAELGEEWMIIGTSALIQTELDSAVNALSSWFNPFLIWGKIHGDGRLPISFQFHHAQMDGAAAAAFLQKLRDVIDEF